tara:strand:+ start:86 stop:577 length:492 start_codon:yes stop_codon:yes gene_type:complete
MKINNLHFINIFIIISLIVSCSQTIDYKSIIEEYESKDHIVCKSLLEVEGKLIMKGSLFEGSCLEYDAEFVKKIKLVTYKQGVEDGINIGYYPDGKVEYLGFKSNGEINGEFVKLHNNGEIAILGQFKNGLYVGKFKFYDESGEIAEIHYYNNFGILTKKREY